MIESKFFVLKQYSDTSEWAEVKRIAEDLIGYLNQPKILKLLDDANQPSVSSGVVQKIFLEKATELGFKDESIGLFGEYANRKLRPDYFLRLQTTGILMEVERGKTNDNNMDFLDFWKCHICKHADYLYLCVPKVLKQNASVKTVKRPFQKVVLNMEPFFMTENSTNVKGMVIIGY